MRQQDYNDVMRLPDETSFCANRRQILCPSCNSPYLGDGKKECVDCENSFMGMRAGK